MTEYELADIVATYSSNAGSFFTVYLTIVSGYLITAFVAGSRLTTVQVSILNVGFAVAVFVMIWATYGAGSTQVHYTNKLLLLAEDAPQANRAWVMNIMAVLMAGGFLASLYFMWGVRNPKTE